MFSIPTAPAKQSVSETITVLSGRLSSATLLEDRRAAILGLRSFSKDFPASVASGALRSLIGSLSKDGEDVDTVKVVLETLLMLFNPNENSPEASEEIALWLADEFTQRQENITLLLDFLESADFYSRLYSLQLLAAILSARTERTEECVFTAPLGISRLVSVLDDQREAIRNEAITLLTYLTPTSLEIQKLVAFENAFDRLFNIIEADGSLADGGRTVEDCLILLANLLRGNTSNQSLFRESGCISRMANLLSQVLQPQSETPEIASWAQAQKNRNVYAFLVIIRLFITPGSVGTSQNQTAIWRHGLAYHVLQLAFSPGAQVQIKAEALVTSGDVIRQNAALQENFAQIMVPSPLDVGDGVTEKANGRAKVYVIDALLDLTLCIHDPQEFDVRFAACGCLQAYFTHHAEVRLHFLGRAIDGHQSGRDESSNVLSVLLQPSEGPAPDPYRYWFAAVITFHLLYDSPDTKAKAMSLTEGDASNGEEVVTGIQTIAAHVISGLRRGDDARILVGYLMLLLGWLFEDFDAVNDFLVEGSNVQSLIQAVSQPAAAAGGELVQGLCAMLLGVVYEFSTKDSPIPRATLHSIFTSRLDRDQYIDRLSKLRSHPILREFEVTPQKLDTSSPGRVAEVYFDSVFVDFFKDNYSRAVRAIDRDPGMEISVVSNGVQQGISRELVDSLRAQLEDKDRAIQDVQAAMASLEGQLGQERADHRRTKESCTVDISRIKSVNEGLQKHHGEELRKLQAQLASKENDHRKQLAQLQTQQTAKDGEHQKQLVQTRKAAEAEAERSQRRKDAEMADLRATISRLEVDVLKAQKSKTQELQEAREQGAAELRALEARRATELKELKERSTAELQALEAHSAAELEDVRERIAAELAEQKSKTQEAEARRQALEKQLREYDTATKGSQVKTKELESKLAESNKVKETTQSELEDLLMVFGDLEEKVAKYKARLAELGEAVSDGEDDDDDEDEDEDEEDGEDDKGKTA
ncbi:p115 like vesicle tethering protein [Dactylonectria estremocensis]|uniref:P115 like vesicle tethering protein n=1 Tax=Dactylonectria estremocensis TaxID=1079267 RepID=A0A9P9EE21_9HYPO|nr:p115 like vesicle tethering protein [Dactylonectria estremocensis]